MDGCRLALLQLLCLSLEGLRRRAHGSPKIQHFVIFRLLHICTLHSKPNLFPEQHLPGIGQFQGGAAQGIGWALNEEYIYGEDGRLQNAGFLDYRVPVASDLPMIDTIIVEVPSDSHPFGVRGVGETGIAPPLPAIANAIADATGKRLRHLPISPPKVLKAIKEDS